MSPRTSRSPGASAPSAPDNSPNARPQPIIIVKLVFVSTETSHETRVAYFGLMSAFALFAIHAVRRTGPRRCGQWPVSNGKHAEIIQEVGHEGRPYEVRCGQVPAVSKYAARVRGPVLRTKQKHLSSRAGATSAARRIRVEGSLGLLSPIPTLRLSLVDAVLHGIRLIARRNADTYGRCPQLRTVIAHRHLRCRYPQ